MWRGMLPVSLAVGTHLIEVRATEESKKEHLDHRVIRVQAD